MEFDGLGDELQSSKAFLGRPVIKTIAKKAASKSGSNPVVPKAVAKKDTLAVDPKLVKAAAADTALGAIGPVTPSIPQDTVYP